MLVSKNTGMWNGYITQRIKIKNLVGRGPVRRRIVPVYVTRDMYQGQKDTD